MNGSLKIMWSDSLATGNKAIDIQHKYLVDIINDLAELIEAGHSPAKIRNILNLLQHYTEWHFHREELCMERHRCPAAAINQSAHADFIRTFVAFRKEYAERGGCEDFARRMYNELTAWLVNHIQRVDGQITPCMGEAPLQT
ncbi:bacteriohemerythrin [Methylomagnum ishizawai]|uniref:bacteriohemerythrin n=1 Tax=Methylomagnum ishizawai TaxID=1760988 RepID=UPI001C327A71|nr:hemerythrin family protein [Methylomagnum ishizawai]BBL73565.1 hemerythrin [Methylomagnum ishizawai]